MSDILVKPGDYDGKNLQLSQPGQVLKAAPGYDVVRLNTTVEILASAVGAQVDRSIVLVRDPRHTSSGMVKSSADSAGIHCEIDVQGKPFQGVQLLNGCNNPNIDWLYVHDVGLGVVPPGGASPQYHGIYCQTVTGLTGSNLRFERIGGYGMQFYPDCYDAKITQVTTDTTWGALTFWGRSARNTVTKLLALNSGKAGVVMQHDSSLNPAVDYVTSPKAGYGYQAAVAPPPTVDVVAGLAAVKTGIAELELTDAWRLYKNTASSHTFKCHAALVAARAALGG